MENASKLESPYRYIAIEGVIGVGKTTLAGLLASMLDGREVLEDYKTNPFIEDFYRSHKTNAFKTQLFFLISRFKTQLELPQPDLFTKTIITDFVFHKDRIYASVNLDDNELELYDSIWKMLEPRVNPPDLVVYLQASTKTLTSRIKKRGRDYEKGITSEYLEVLNRAYNEFFFQYSLSPVFIVNTDDIDFVESPEHLQDLVQSIVKVHGGISFYHPKG
jgi:deoxyadenosine/deoxycytidine kinase